jgi:hypothetical protein
MFSNNVLQQPTIMKNSFALNMIHPPTMTIPPGGQGCRGGRGGNARGVINSNHCNALNDEDPPQPITTEDDNDEMESSIKHSKF